MTLSQRQRIGCISCSYLCSIVKQSSDAESSAIGNLTSVNFAKKFRKLFLIVALLMLSVPAVKAQNAAVKTNLLGWATTNLNIGGELGIGRKSTVQIFATLNPWNFSNLKRYRYWNLMPEYRYFFCEKFSGHFVGVHLLGGEYNVRNVNLSFFGLPDLTTPENGPIMTSDGVMKARHAEGWYAGVGITYGYQWMINRRWNIEASIGIGYAYSPYTLYGRCNKIIEEGKCNYFGPTKIAVSAMYVF